VRIPLHLGLKVGGRSSRSDIPLTWELEWEKDVVIIGSRLYVPLTRVWKFGEKEVGISYRRCPPHLDPEVSGRMR
jgi:hypothetical protein